MYWALNSDEISKISEIEKYGTRNSDVVFLDFGDDKQDADPLLFSKVIPYLFLILFYLDVYYLSRFLFGNICVSVL